MKKRKKKIAVAVTHRTPYGRLKPIMRAIQNHPDLELQVIVGTPVFMHNLFFALRHGDPLSLRKALPWYIRSRLRTIFKQNPVIDRRELLSRTMREDGFPIHARLPLFLEGGSLATMTKSVASGLLGLPKIFQKLKPDIVLVHADRFEMLPVAVAASLMNIPVAHTQGGDITGTIDETVRHTITKLAHVHFPTTEKSKERLLRMGENPKFVFMAGCPTIDTLREVDLAIDPNIFARNGRGYGDLIDLSKPYLLVLQHPVTTEYENAKRNMEETLNALERINLPVLFFWPNIDAGSDGASEAVRSFIKRQRLPGFTLYKSFKSEDFYRVLNAAAVAVGNSSSFIREGSYLGVPAVLVGTRQNGRERADNILEAGYDANVIESAIRAQLTRGRYPKSLMYGDGNAASRIADILSEVAPSPQKRFYE